MDVGNVTSTLTLEAIVAAWSEAMTAETGAELGGRASLPAQAVNGSTTALPITAAGFVEGAVDAPHAGAATTMPAHLAGTRTDHGPEIATLQTFARPHAPVAEPQRPVETALPTAAHAHSEFAIPAAQLLPVTLVGLQVEHAAGWPFPYQHGFRAAPPEPVRTPTPEMPAFESEADIGGDDTAAQHDPEDAEAEAVPDGLVFDEPDAAAWCEPLTRTLSEALAAKPPPQALLAAADQWQRGRCVVLACPQGADPAGPAWVFVLWPRRKSRAILRNETAHRTPLLTLFGLRVEARLQWAASPRRTSWCHVRLVKEHHPRRGRQLVSPDRDDVTSGPGPQPSIPCEVQLGPVLVRSLRRCEVCVRINAVRRFWAALGGQWSVNVVVSALPLAPSIPVTVVEAAC